MVFYDICYYFEVNIVAAQKQAQLVTIFVFYKFPLPSTLTSPLTYRCSDVPERASKEKCC